MRMRAAAAAAIIGAALLAGLDAPTTAAGVDAAGSSSEVAPIVVLLDVSDSMNEDDGAGTVKLQGAKTAVRQIVGALSDSTVFGVWSFPTSGCDGGGYVSAPAPLTDRTAVIGSIDRMRADHSTPTGVALRSLADDLTTRGYAGATIVLVSDGESTCGPPPCDVANDLVDEGFDVTVPTIGFRTSPSGAEELACVAAATGAQSYAVDDSDQLATKLQDLVRAQLDVSVRYDPSPMPGGSTRITATVTHTAGEPAHDVRITLGLNDDAGRRAAVPPMMRIGNIPVGESLERTWTVGTGARDSSVTTAFTVSVWASNATRAVFDGRYTTTPTRYQKDELGDLFAGVSEQHPLVVFGDSYSSGEGVGGDYSIPPTGIDPSCHRSIGTYLGTIFRDQQTLNVACSGAVTRDLGEKSDKTNLSQIAQLERAGLAPAVGVMTFGGNDIGFAGIVAECINPLPGHGCGDAKYRDDKLRSVEAHADALARAYRLAWSAMNTPEMRAKRDGAYAPLVVLAYPLVTHEEFRGKCHQFGPDEVATADRLGKKLNSVIAAAVERVKNEGYEVHFVADTASAVRPDHTLCEWSDEAYINGWIPAANGSYAASESVHPKASGYLAETDAIIGWSGTSRRFAPDVDDEIIRNDVAPSCAPIERDWPTIIDPRSTQELELVRCGSALLKGTGFLPGAPVTVTAHSTQTLLGTIVPDEAGRIEEKLVLPESLAPGRHEIVVTGLDADGRFVEYRIAASVTEPVPVWLWTALGVAILAVVAGGVLTTIGLVRRRRTRAVGSPA